MIVMEGKSRIRKIKSKHWLAISIASLVLIGVIWTITTALLIWTYTDEESSRQSDAAIILGAAVEGENPSPVFRERIEHAILLYRQGRSAICSLLVVLAGLESVLKPKLDEIMPLQMV
ncbi:YdcF family protein [Paenibacillus sp. 1A_MP2]|uniref:YdcF family protein n=1 Tax=Paenibacillus sp. 1A_MP2 TaxID=3457495 RepID=UPI003FCE7DB2